MTNSGPVAVPHRALQLQLDRGGQEMDPRVGAAENGPLRFGGRPSRTKWSIFGWPLG